MHFAKDLADSGATITDAEIDELGSPEHVENVLVRLIILTTAVLAAGGLDSRRVAQEIAEEGAEVDRRTGPGRDSCAALSAEGGVVGDALRKQTSRRCERWAPHWRPPAPRWVTSSG